MILTELPLPGAFLIEIDKRVDERGYFARTFSAAEFAERGLDTTVDQCSISYNTERLTLRGMHYQAAPYGENKLVRCTRGAIFDVAVDLRPESPRYLGWHGVELSAENGAGVYWPQGVAHGFLTLCDGAEVAYQISAPYMPEAGRGIRWDDPAVGIAWPDRPRVVSERDAQFPNLVP